MLGSALQCAAQYSLPCIASFQTQTLLHLIGQDWRGRLLFREPRPERVADGGELSRGGVHSGHGKLHGGRQCGALHRAGIRTLSTVLLLPAALLSRKKSVAVT